MTMTKTKRILALLLSFVMIFTSLPIMENVASAKPGKPQEESLSINGADVIYVGETYKYECKGGRGTWKISEGMENATITSNENNAQITAVKKGKIILSVTGTQNKKATKEITIKEKEVKESTIEVTWGNESKKDLPNDLKNISISNNNIELKVDNEYDKVVKIERNKIEGVNLGTCTLSAEDQTTKYVYNVTVVPDYTIYLTKGESGYFKDYDKKDKLYESAYHITGNASAYDWNIIGNSEVFEFTKADIIGTGWVGGHEYYGTEKITGTTSGTGYFIKQTIENLLYNARYLFKVVVSDKQVTIDYKYADGTPDADKATLPSSSTVALSNVDEVLTDKKLTIEGYTYEINDKRSNGNVTVIYSPIYHYNVFKLDDKEISREQNIKADKLAQYNENDIVELNNVDYVVTSVGAEENNETIINVKVKTIKVDFKLEYGDEIVGTVKEQQEVPYNLTDDEIKEKYGYVDGYNMQGIWKDNEKQYKNEKDSDADKTIIYDAVKVTVKYIDNETKESIKKDEEVSYYTFLPVIDQTIDIENDLKDRFTKEDPEGYSLVKTDAKANNNFPKTVGDTVYKDLTNDVIVTCSYSKNSYTVTYMYDENTKLGTETVKYNDSAKKADDMKKAAEKIDKTKTFNGWSSNGKSADLTKITSDITVYASMGDKIAVTIKHYLDYYKEKSEEFLDTIIYKTENETIDYTKQFENLKHSDATNEIYNNYDWLTQEEIDALNIKFDGVDSDGAIGLNYWASRINVYKVVGDDEPELVRTNLYAYNNLLLSEVEEGKEKEAYTTYLEKALNAKVTINDAEKIMTSADIASYDSQDGFTHYTYNAENSYATTKIHAGSNVYSILNMYIVYDVNEDSTEFTFVYKTLDPYGNLITLDDTHKETVLNKYLDGDKTSNKDYWIGSSNYYKVMNENMPEGYYCKYDANVNPSGTVCNVKEGIVTVYCYLNNAEVQDNVLYAIRKSWTIKYNSNGYTCTDGTWYDLSPKASVKYDKETGKIVSYDIPSEGWTSGKLTINNETATWSTYRFDKDTKKLWHSGNVNGIYADPEKEGLVDATYMVTTLDGTTTEYGQGQIQFIVGEKTSSFDHFVEPTEINEEITHRVIWNKIYFDNQVEGGKYIVYGKETNLPLNLDTIDATKISTTIKLPEGMKTLTSDNYSLDFVLSNASEKLLEQISNIEDDLIEADKNNGIEVAKVKKSDIYSLLENGLLSGTLDDDRFILVSNDALKSNYDKYTFEVVFEKQNATFETFKLRNSTKEIAEKQAIAYAKDVVRNSNSEFAGIAFDEETIEVSGISDANSTLYTNVYTVYVRLTTVSTEKSLNGITFLVSGNVDSTRTRRRKVDNSDKEVEEIDDTQAPLAGGAISDLRNTRPNDMLTRSEFVGVLSQIFTVLDAGTYKPFEDISGDVNEDSIKKLSGVGIITGYSDEEFGTNDYITREQMYLILARALKFTGKATSLTEEEIKTQLEKVLSNTEVSDWASEGVAIAIEKGLTAETENQQGNITRSEAADKLEKFTAILYNSDEDKDNK